MKFQKLILLALISSISLSATAQIDFPQDPKIPSDCGTYFSDASEAALKLANAHSKFILIRYQCGRTNKAEVLKLLLHAVDLNSPQNWCKATRRDNRKAIMDHIRNDVKINAAMTSYLGFRLFMSGVNQYEINDKNLSILVEALEGTEFLASFSKRDSPFSSLKFGANGKAEVQILDPQTLRYRKVQGAWSVAMKLEDPSNSYPRYLPVIEVTAEGLTEQIIVANDQPQYRGSVRLKRYLSALKEDDGWDNEVRMCAQ